MLAKAAGKRGDLVQLNSQNLFLFQFVESFKLKNDTVITFLSPAVNESQFFRTYVQLDNIQTELTPFEYHPDPTFDRLSKTVITENSMIIVTVSIRSTHESDGGLHACDRALVCLRAGGFPKP